MSCSKIRDLLPDYSVKMLDGRAQREVEAHLTQCEGCRAELKAQDDVMALVEQFGGVNPPVGLFNAVRNRIEGGDFVRERPAWWAFLLSRPARVGAMGLAMAAVMAGLLLPTGESSLPSLPVTATTNRGEMASELASSIRQHAMAAGQGPLADRVAWEAMAQMVTQDKDKDKDGVPDQPEPPMPGVE